LISLTFSDPETWVGDLSKFGDSWEEYGVARGGSRLDNGKQIPLMGGTPASQKAIKDEYKAVC